MTKEATFFLDKPNGDKITHLFLKFTCNDGVLKYSAKIKLHPSTWNFENQMSKVDKKINSEINRLSIAVERYCESCRIIGKEVLVEELRAELNGNTGRKERRKNLNIFHYIDVLIKMAESGNLLTPVHKTLYSPGTLKSWNNSRNRLMDFNPNLTFNEISLDTYNDFIKWCISKGYTKNTIGKLIKDFKNFIALSRSKKWHNNFIDKDDSFKKLSEKSFQVSLDENEIKGLYEFDLSGTPNLEIIRDRFIIGFYTGFRISDMKRLLEDNFNEDLITQVNQKTKKRVVIPVHDYIKEIIKKYNGLPRQYTDVTVNRSIKEIARMTGLFNTKVRFVKTIGGVEKEFIKYKWQMISTHTVRRSMVTNILKHVSTVEAQSVVGMSLKTLELYNKRTAEENAELIKESSFFNKK